MNLLASTILAAFVSFGPCTPIVTGEGATDLASQGRAFAVPPADEPSAITFELIDMNGDGVITADELAEWFVSDDPAIDVFDTDMDGVVTLLEFETMCFEPNDAVEV